MRPIIWFAVVSSIFLVSTTYGKSLGMRSESAKECTICNMAVRMIYTYIQENQSLETTSKALTNTCIDLKIFSPAVCKGLVEVNLPTLLYIYHHSDVVQGNICGILLVGKNCRLSDPDKLEWSIKPSAVPKPPVIQSNPPPTGSPTLKVVQISDVHWDPEYVEGSNAVCDEPLCCRVTSGPVSHPTHAAGYWGDYRSCDIPWRTIEKALEHISRQHPDVDYIMWTGDLIPHNVWSSNRDENVSIMRHLVNLFRQYFPSTPVYPTLGNHEASPVNSFAPPEVTDEQFSTDWLYREAETQWANWLPEEAWATVRHGGYYTAMIKPGLRIISINMNYCYVINWWILYRSQDPASGLLWLSQVLQQAERNGEKVHIMSHIPPGNYDCWAIFSREYARLVNRYESTIAAQFFGHTHADEFKVFYDTDDPSRATNVAFIGPSLTTYSNKNPGYRVYTIDGHRQDSTWAVLDHSTWVVNLTRANLNGAEDPVWFELYSARSEYDLIDLSPAEMSRFVGRMLHDERLFGRYLKNFHKAADVSSAAVCDDQCKRKLLCSIVTTNIWDQSHCTDVERLLTNRF